MKCPNSGFPTILSLGEPFWSAVMCSDSELEQVDKVLGWKWNGTALWVIGCARVIGALERNIKVRWAFSTASHWLVVPYRIAAATVQSLSCVWLFRDPVDYSLSGSFVHGILQARIQERVAISFSRGSSHPRDQIDISCIGGRFFYCWATREASHYVTHFLSILCIMFTIIFFKLWFWKLSKDLLSSGETQTS